MARLVARITGEFGPISIYLPCLYFGSCFSDMKVSLWIYLLLIVIFYLEMFKQGI
jgi:hypothetical protein